ncbi:MAG: alpha-amylase family glycosyl hydrolase [candidate division Zixibacteria bacterium]|nr:alpha-amylase family glycosyl hydrolase [candidate division Zixibacteria bacterium]
MMANRTIERVLHKYFPFGFHLSRQAWEILDIQSLARPTADGRKIPVTYAARNLADRFNLRRFHTARDFEPIQPGQLITVGVIVDILRYVATVYCHEQIPGVMSKGLDAVAGKSGRAITEKPIGSFVGLFPPKTVVVDGQSEKDYLEDRPAATENRETAASEIVLLYFAMANPAFRPFQPLFDDRDLKRQSPYVPLVNALEEFFSRQPAFAPLGLTLFQCLRAPIEAAPDSLEGQLEYIKKHWAAFLPQDLLEQLLLASDILKEEFLLRGLGPGPSRVMDFVRDEYGLDAGYHEPACFSPDADWMSNVVLIAKSIYVWLDQLSKRYSRHIRFLSDVPDEELDRLNRWGFTGLWLIGVWERSPASKTIKQMMGNPEAESSAYSLYDYVIAADLGGEEAYQNLRERAWRRGIRLASDMVPNHMGIYSRWVIEHPGWFMQSDYPPFPVYQFTGADLSRDERVGIQIEDGYWTHRDAAVTFKRVDRWTGAVTYIYHGNDGTSMPWNDTAQLNFLLPEVREAVIQTILHVARKFSIIRFDAAMTLAKRHFQRLWYPKPGDGGAIPSRAERGMSKAAFDAAFPKEFWREVVDRVAAEVPDTLLIAEAFWLMEGYFVRTLGMHRVYNSAFMNMLKMEDNGKYRTTVKNVLEFSPEVIKRFVNFMNNPDERTAVEQFGRGDKYFGVAMMLVTMPGLPMFGHGQIEGFTEKYGMEYRKAYWDEMVDEEMVRRHEREIFPLMRRRKLFSGAANFAFYDFFTPGGWVDENVFAYSNRAGDERAVILYNNAYNTTSGHIHSSTPINVGVGEDKFLTRKSLGEALALNTAENVLYSMREFRSGQEYLRGGRQMAQEGLHAQLYAYQFQAFLDFREIHDTDGSWWELQRRLNGVGVPSLALAYQEMKLEPVRGPFRAAVNGDMLRGLITGKTAERKQFDDNVVRFLESSRAFIHSDTKPDAVMADISRELDALLKKDAADSLAAIEGSPKDDIRHILTVGTILRHLGCLNKEVDTASIGAENRRLIDEWMLINATADAFREFGRDDSLIRNDALATAILAGHDDLLFASADKSLSEKTADLFRDDAAKEFLQINLYNDVLWLSKEQLERLMGIIISAAFIQSQAAEKSEVASFKAAGNASRRIFDAAERAGYNVRQVIELLAVAAADDTRPAR